MRVNQIDDDLESSSSQVAKGLEIVLVHLPRLEEAMLTCAEDNGPDYRLLNQKFRDDLIKLLEDVYSSMDNLRANLILLLDQLKAMANRHGRMSKATVARLETKLNYLLEMQVTLLNVFDRTERVYHEIFSQHRELRRKGLLICKNCKDVDPDACSVCQTVTKFDC